MERNYNLPDYTREIFCSEAEEILDLVRSSDGIDSARHNLYMALSESRYDKAMKMETTPLEERVINRDCTRSLRGMLLETSDAKSGFSIMQALWDIAQGTPRPDLQAGFYGQMIHLVRGMQGRASYKVPADTDLDEGLEGREAALVRSSQLDALANRVSKRMEKYPDGLQEESIRRREARRNKILSELGGTLDDWNNWKWQMKNVIKNPDILARLATLSPEEEQSIRQTIEANLPFALTPYYASLLDDDPESGRDRAIRAQVLPPQSYVDTMGKNGAQRREMFDFMQEHDTSPIDLVTRRYPNIVILKPYNTCPQICVYCQRNWEIEEALSPHALAPWKKIEAACAWIEEHPAIHEVLVTGGDPLAMPDATLRKILERLSKIDHLDLIRIGTRVPITMPMRITREFADLLGSFRKLAKREIALVTHVEHVYEITPELAHAVDLLRRNGIGVYNQLVYTFHVSRRFESSKLRFLLRRLGIDPYYTFVPKGKEETLDYRVPIARIMQEAKEEVRLIPGLRRTDAPVYNVPRLGKNHLRALQHRDFLSVLPDGSRVYEFHPWEKNVSQRDSYVANDVPIYEYLNRLGSIGEDPGEYDSIWYYF